MSQIEERYKALHPVFHEQYKVTGLVDKNGKPFNAFTDSGIIPLPKPIRGFNEITVELKEHPLNTHTTIEASTNKMKTQASWKGIQYPANASNRTMSNILYRSTEGFYDHLSGWNHSATKQQLVSEKLAEEKILLVVVFSSHPATLGNGRQEKPFREYYRHKYGLFTLLEREFNDLIERGVIPLKKPIEEQIE